MGKKILKKIFSSNVLFGSYLFINVLFLINMLFKHYYFNYTEQNNEIVPYYFEIVAYTLPPLPVNNSIIIFDTENIVIQKSTEDFLSIWGLAQMFHYLYCFLGYGGYSSFWELLIKFLDQYS